MKYLPILLALVVAACSQGPTAPTPPVTPPAPIVGARLTVTITSSQAQAIDVELQTSAGAILDRRTVQTHQAFTYTIDPVPQTVRILAVSHVATIGASGAVRTITVTGDDALTIALP